MRTIRRHARSGAALWLVCHVALLWAFVPRDCCAAHGLDEAGSHAPHTVRPAAPSESKATCPLHREVPPPRKDCAIEGACRGPLAALPQVWSKPGVPVLSFELAGDPAAEALVAEATAAVLAQESLPDTPPPRA